MKIAVACEGRHVAEHFGHCEGFAIFETEGQRILSGQLIQNPGHRPGFLPVFLSEKGANVIISGGMGMGAVELFNEKGIEVVTGASGDAEMVAGRYLRGELKSAGSVCHEHKYADECGH
jgi:predicted Fe-Mo cluster-binding NifX family protein